MTKLTLFGTAGGQWHGVRFIVCTLAIRFAKPRPTRGDRQRGPGKIAVGIQRIT